MKIYENVNINLYINRGNAIVSLQGDIYNAADDNIICEIGAKRYTYDGETTLKEFITMYVNFCREILEDVVNETFTNYKIKRYYI